MVILTEPFGCTTLVIASAIPCFCRRKSLAPMLPEPSISTAIETVGCANAFGVEFMNTVITAINSTDNNNLLIKDFTCPHYPAYPTPIAHTQHFLRKKVLKDDQKV